jgi:NAD(P)-dependent dehydrogenase (short-subunit alcohol dehydrogenase family)
MVNLDGKVGIVTGGGTGIGRATALAMATAGAAVVIGNRDAA